MYNPSCNSYFSGGGFLDIGLMQAGIDIRQHLDIDPFATEAMKANPQYFTGHKILNEDITQKTVLSQDRPDIISATYPCTKYSPIADIHGTRTGDELYLHFFRHLAIHQPEAYVLENVPGMRKFKVVMEAVTKLPQYYVNVFCPVDALNWVPQSRKRLIIIGTKKPFMIQPPVFERRIKLSDIIEKDPEIHLPDYVIARINGEYRDKPIIVDPNQRGAFAPTCVAHYEKDLGTRMVVDKRSKYGVRPFTIREYARLQGIPDDYKFKDSGSSYRLIGNGVPTPMGRWAGGELMRYFN